MYLPSNYIMKYLVIKKRDGQMWELYSNEYDTIGEARVKLSEIAHKLTENEIDEDERWSYDNDVVTWDVYTYKIVKSSNVHYDHSYGLNDYFTIK